MPPSDADRILTSVSRIESDADTLHSIVHGAFDAADVPTEGGNVKPVAKVIHEAEAALAAISASYRESINDATAVTEIAAPFPKIMHTEKTRVEGAISSARTFVLIQTPVAPGTGCIVMHRITILSAGAVQLVWRRVSGSGPVLHSITTNGIAVEAFAMFVFNGTDWLYLSSQYPADAQTAVDVADFGSDFSNEFR